MPPHIVKAQIRIAERDPVGLRAHRSADREGAQAFALGQGRAEPGTQCPDRRHIEVRRAGAVEGQGGAVRAGHGRGPGEIQIDMLGGNIGGNVRRLLFQEGPGIGDGGVEIDALAVINHRSVDAERSVEARQGDGHIDIARLVPVAGLTVHIIDRAINQPHIAEADLLELNVAGASGRRVGTRIGRRAFGHGLEHPVGFAPGIDFKIDPRIFQNEARDRNAVFQEEGQHIDADGQRADFGHQRVLGAVGIREADILDRDRRRREERQAHIALDRQLPARRLGRHRLDLRAIGLDRNEERQDDSGDQ